MSKRISIAVLALAVLLLLPSPACAQGTEGFVAFFIGAPVALVLGAIFIFIVGRSRGVLIFVLLLWILVVAFLMLALPGWFDNGMGLPVLAIAVVPVCVCMLVAVLLGRSTMSGPERLVYLALALVGIVGPFGLNEYRHRHRFDAPLPPGYKEPDRSGAIAWGVALRKFDEGMPIEEAVRTVTPGPERVETPNGTQEDPRCRVKYIWKNAGSDSGSYICVDAAGIGTTSALEMPLGPPRRDQ